jgi:hypothetical protein
LTTVTQNAEEESAECPATQLLGDANPGLTLSGGFVLKHWQKMLQAE